MCKTAAVIFSIELTNGTIKKTFIQAIVDEKKRWIGEKRERREPGTPLMICM